MILPFVSSGLLIYSIRLVHNLRKGKGEEEILCFLLHIFLKTQGSEWKDTPNAGFPYTRKNGFSIFKIQNGKALTVFSGTLGFVVSWGGLG